MSQAALTKDEILNADDCRVEPVDMTEFGWPGIVYVGILRGNELERVAGLYKDGAPTGSDYLAKMAAVFLRDENGKRIIDDKEAGALGFKSGAALTHIVERGVKLNRIDDETVDEAEKN